MALYADKTKLREYDREIELLCDAKVYTDENFPSYELLEHLDTSYLDQTSYNAVKERCIDEPVPDMGKHTVIPEDLKRIPWSLYYVMIAISYES